jgi:hypothetical protein
VSIVYTADVFCDGDCSLWTSGVTGVRPPAKTDARLTAARTAKWVHHKGKDYCPGCWAGINRAPAQEPGAQQGDEQ